MSACPVCGSRVDGNGDCSRCGVPVDGSQSPTRRPDTKPLRGAKPAAGAGGFGSGATIAGRYRIIEPLGRGAMGEVVRAEDLSLHQTVALKFLPAAFANDPQALDRVREEVRMARRVSHRNVCRVHDLGEADGQLFISMEYVDGEDLATLLRRVGRLAGDRALEIARELCAGLSAAHAAGVIHRDLKPANVMLDREGRVRITDFGLALLGEDGAAAGEIAGTPAYMAPEQLAGAGATVRSDLYALGLVLYELLTGRRPFPASATLAEQLRHRRETAVLPPGQLVRDLDPVVERTILHCLATRPEERPESALTVLTALSGGDPLKAAVAAGQTPTPSAVAAAPVVGVLAPAWAWACVGVVLASVALVIGLGNPFSEFERVRPPYPPAALALKAEEAMRALGYEGACVDDASGLAYDHGARHASISNPGAQALAAEHHAIIFWYRCSPVPLVPRGQTMVTRLNPPMGPGEALAEIDVSGRLLRYVSQPPSTRDPAGAGRAASNLPATLLRLTGLTTSSVPGVSPEDGSFSIDAVLEGKIPARIEVDVRRSRVVQASVVWPWTPPSKTRAVRILRAEDIPDLLFLVLTVASLPLAYRNVKSGSGDRDGARRVGLLVFGGLLVTDLLQAQHPSTFSGFDTLFELSVSIALYWGVTTAFFYLALEPIVRRVWPERLVSWTRLLAGDVRDPLVARDVLLGMATFYGLMGLSLLTMLAARTPILPPESGLEPLQGLERCVASTAFSVTLAVRLGLLFLLLLLLLRALGRIRWLAPVVFFAVVAAFFVSYLGSIGGFGAITVPVALVFGMALLLLLVRVGLLAVTVLLFLGILTLIFPNVTHLTGWSAFCPWWLLGITILGAASGLYFSTAGRPFGDRRLIE